MTYDFIRKGGEYMEEGKSWIQPNKIIAKLFDTDQYLIKQIVHDNDKNAAELLINKYYKFVYKEIYLKTSDRELAMDLTQETFIAMLRGLASFDDKKASFKTWLKKVASNKVIDYRRSRQNHEMLMTEVLEDYDSPGEEDIENSIINKAAKEKVMNELNLTDENTKKIFVMRAEEGYSFSDIAQEMNLSLSTTKNKYYATIKKLRKGLSDYE